MGATPEAQTGPQKHNLIHQLGRLYYDLVPMFEQFIGMSIARWRILINLRVHGEMSQAGLQQHIKVDPAAITRQVKQLEEEQLITRRTDPQDNRFTLVTLTETGHRLAEHAHMKLDIFEKRLTSTLSERDLELLHHCLQQMRAQAQSLTDEQIGQRAVANDAPTARKLPR